MEGALTYQVLRGATPDVATATLLASNLTTLTFIDTQPPSEVDLYYWVRGTDLEQTGPFSEPATARQNVLQWTWSSTGSLTMPVILTNGWVAVGINRINPFDRPPNLGHIYALTAQGAVVWDYDTTSTGIIQPAVGPNGQLIAGFSRSNTNSFLLSLNTEGVKNFRNHRRTHRRVPRGWQ